VNIVNWDYQVCFKPVKLLLYCQSTTLLLTSLLLPVGPFWFCCSFLFVQVDHSSNTVMHFEILFLTLFKQLNWHFSISSLA